MSEPKRYRNWVSVNTCGMGEHENGSYILYSDYSALQADNERLVLEKRNKDQCISNLKAQLHSAEQRIAVLTKKLQTIADSKRDEYLSFIAKDAIGLPHKHDFKCHDPGDYGDGCLHDAEGREQHVCRYCGITRAAQTPS